jgi:DNA processing protein
VRPRDAADAADWVRLIRSENVGPATFYALLERFGTAGEALAALPALAENGGLRRPITVATTAAVEREREAAKRIGARHVFFGSRDYPPLLAAIHAPPPVIMVRGDVALLTRRPVAIVGSRKASAAGRTMARMLADGIGSAGRAVVSGLALGIDAEAHRATLGTGTVAVVAGGVDRPTPEEHRDLADEIAAAGALVSEMPLGLNPLPRDYPRRNRLIAGLSEGVVVVEAAERSGSLHTAHYALNENREVFAVPGSPLDPRAAGCLKLLRDGATLTVDARDVLAALERPRDLAPLGFAEGEDRFEEPPAEYAAPSPATAIASVREVLSLVPVPVDAIVRATALPAQAVVAALTELELAGAVEREPDGKVRAAL